VAAVDLTPAHIETLSTRLASLIDLDVTAVVGWASPWHSSARRVSACRCSVQARHLRQALGQHDLPGRRICPSTQRGITMADPLVYPEGVIPSFRYQFCPMCNQTIGLSKVVPRNHKI